MSETFDRPFQTEGPLPFSDEWVEAKVAEWAEADAKIPGPPPTVDEILELGTDLSTKQPLSSN